MVSTEELEGRALEVFIKRLEDSSYIPYKDLISHVVWEGYYTQAETIRYETNVELVECNLEYMRQLVNNVVIDARRVQDWHTIAVQQNLQVQCWFTDRCLTGELNRAIEARKELDCLYNSHLQTTFFSRFYNRGIKKWLRKLCLTTTTS